MLGCNLALDFEQCRSDADCGGYPDGRVCSIDNVCVLGDAGCSGSDCVPIDIGHVSAQNGPNANLGVGMAVGIDTAFREFNAAGGLNGRPLNLVIRDDGYEPENTVLGMDELTTGGRDRAVLAIVGNVGTPTASVAVPIAIANDVVFHGAFTGAGLLRQDPPDRVVFNYRASYVQETEALVHYLREVRDLADRVPAQNIGVLAQGESAAADDISAFDGYGSAGFTGVAQALSGLVSSEDIPVASYERNTSNIDVAADHFVAWLASGDAVESGGVIQAAIIMVPTADPAANLVVRMKDAIEAAANGQDPANMTLTDEQRTTLAKVNLFMASVSFVGSDKLQENLRGQGTKYCPSVGVSQVVPFPTGSATGAIDYREALGRYNTEVGAAHVPGFVSFEGYLAGRLFIEGLTAAPSLDTAGLVAGLESLQGVEYGIGTELSFGIDDHQASDKVFGTMLDSNCDFEKLELD